MDQKTDTPKRPVFDPDKAGWERYGTEDDGFIGLIGPWWMQKKGDSYDYARKCSPRSTPGIRMLTSWIDRHFPGESWGVYRCQKLSKNTKSLHSEGRALDWRLDAGRKRERRAANFLIERLLEADANGNERALARRMGVQEIIFNCESWFSGSDGMGHYSGCSGRTDRTTAHRDHVHIGLSKAGAAATTSFWKSGLAGS